MLKRLPRFQFPTGWNSTRRGGVFKACRAFQFPTGWNSTRVFESEVEVSDGFNSQRDGILLKDDSKKVSCILFQFPTGWNSTSNPTDWWAKNEVSIPNGMEFYAVTMEDTIIVMAGFNSQRDGILQKQKLNEGVSFSVSIPNGMEFYYERWAPKALLARVSIPNGMEFYSRIWKRSRSIRRFQFPTGWNSTIGSPIGAPYLESFNSQRDGILHHRIRYYMGRSILFQFPTGWNST